MSGSSIPYHLRQNKAVERALFLDQLKKIDAWLKRQQLVSLTEYRYIGFGGPFLEDFKSIHREINITKMISIEYDADTLKRQEFNKPISCIELLEEPMTSSNFIANDDFSEPSIFWLDYVNTKYDEQFTDLRNAIAKMSEYDILKVTLNANVANISGDQDDLQGSRLQSYRDTISSAFLPTDLDPSQFTAKKFHQVLVLTAINALNQGALRKSGVSVKLLSAFVYADGQKMLTITCILIPDDIDCSELDSWEYAFNISNIPNISLPSLSARERIEIERMLPASELQDIKEHLGYKITSRSSDNDILLQNFISYHQKYPWFGKVSI
ncbi:O-methyltransferase [Vibrio parahaemolyticus]|uniref:O-methyltransferase n=1 Tax=Vibrio parahaemolyticus TaxID=670 RepID=UPI0025550689|nr:O-methyltransferase [Vibrio parahaemolyticus]